MAKKGRTHEGNVHCSECGSIIEATSTTCEHCGEALEDEFQAIICPYCGTVLDNDSKECFNCGLKFQATRDVTNLRSQEDEEFLSRLLQWGKTQKPPEAPAQEDIKEEEDATDVFKTFLGSQATTPIVEESIKEIQKTAEEVSELEKREESILKLATPLQTLLKARRQSLNVAEEEIEKIKKELDSMNGSSDPEAISKKAELEMRMSEISIERDEIRQLEDNIHNMDVTYRNLLEKHQQELVEKEANFKVRLTSFKAEMTRREQEKERMKAREEFLKKKEMELTDRIDSLKDREKSLRKTEQEMRKTIDSLKEEKTDNTAIWEQLQYIWLIEEKELKSIMNKSKKARAEWMEGQITAQNELKKTMDGGKSPEEIAKELDIFSKKEKELNKKIASLESALKKTEEQESELSAEEKKLVNIHDDIKEILKEVDDLLGHLPEDKIDAFAKSEKFKIYEKVMDELGL
ncbi:MAG: zinc ribbon domain-containing protein [Thermoplasmata archaeon]|nr:zinc ribbon domain-containing protein [Thermoplasmata archaeon]